MKKRECQLGLDLGRLITDGSMDDMMRELKGGRKDFRTVPHVGGTFKGIRRLVDRWFGLRVWIISACPEELEEKLIEWLGAHVFYTRTRVPHTGHVHFCREYADKTPLACDLGLTHFVDDRPEVLIPMKGKIRHRFLFNPEAEVLVEFEGQLDGITVVWNWRELASAIGATMTDGRRRTRQRQRKKIRPRRRTAH